MLSSEEMLRALLALTPGRVFVIDKEGRFAIEDPNPAERSARGAPVGVSVFELYQDKPEVLDQIRRALAGEEVQFTAEILGEWYEMRAKPLYDADGSLDGAIGSGSIVTDRVRAEKKLLESEARLRGMFAADMIGMMFWDRDGRITDANDAMLKIVGYSREDLEAGRLDWIRMTPPEYLELDERGLAEVEARGTCTPFEKEYIRKDGSRVPVLIGGTGLQAGARGGVAFVLDQSQRKAQERERAQAEAHLRLVVNNAPMVLWSIDERGIFTLSEGRALATLGLLPGQVVGTSAFDMYRDYPQVIDLLRRGLAGEEFTYEVEVAGRKFDTRAIPLRDDAGASVGMLGVSIDVTERRKAEAEHAKLQSHIQEVQKLESLGLLAGGIAHDFNNLLTAILGSAAAAQMVIPRENPAFGDIENVIAAARRAAHLTRQMLAYSGRGHFEIRAIDLSANVRELATLLETTISKKVQLRLELAANLPPVLADTAQIQQVVMNLVINGAEAIGDARGTVLVTTGAQYIDEVYAAGLSATGDVATGSYVFVEVHDTGVGMDAATKAKIFDPFFSTKFAGRGLGLAAVLGIVRSHKGAINVYSSPGSGSTFKVFLPASTESVKTAVPKPAQYRGSGLVLVIDDDEAVSRALGKLLELFGFSVIEARDGRRGVELYEQRAAEIVLVMVDMTMPEMNGEETFRELRSRSDVPVILMSGYNEIEATRRFTAKGLAGFLPKPFTPEELIERLRAALPR
jgi:PAS domain S-box-containing protein